jgi:hypothetical protein
VTLVSAHVDTQKQPYTYTSNDNGSLSLSVPRTRTYTHKSTVTLPPRPTLTPIYAQTQTHTHTHTHTHTQARPFSFSVSPSLTHKQCLLRTLGRRVHEVHLHVEVVEARGLARRHIQVPPTIHLPDLESPPAHTHTHTHNTHTQGQRQTVGWGPALVRIHSYTMHLTTAHVVWAHGHRVRMHAHRQTDRQRDRETDRQTDRQREREGWGRGRRGADCRLPNLDNLAVNDGACALACLLELVVFCLGFGQALQLGIVRVGLGLFPQGRVSTQAHRHTGTDRQAQTEGQAYRHTGTDRETGTGIQAQIEAQRALSLVQRSSVSVSLCHTQTHTRTHTHTYTHALSFSLSLSRTHTLVWNNVWGDYTSSLRAFLSLLSFLAVLYLSGARIYKRPNAHRSPSKQ